MIRIAGLGMLLLLTGCATYSGPYTYGSSATGTPLRTTSLQEANGQVGEQSPVEYRVGYMQGCDSGRLSEGDTTYQHQKDEQRYSVDVLYRQGWDLGYIQCKNRMQLPAYYAGPYGYSPSGYYSGGYAYPQFSFGFSRGFGPRYRPFYRSGGFKRFRGHRH